MMAAASARLFASAPSFSFSPEVALSALGVVDDGLDASDVDGAVVVVTLAADAEDEEVEEEEG